MTSKIRTQLELLPSGERKPEPHVEEVTPQLIKIIRRRANFVDAWNFAQQFAALDNKQVYDVLGVDPSHVTKIQNGRASPPGKVFNSYLDILQNEIPLIWWVESRGYDWTTLLKHRNAVERELEETKEENRQLKRMLGLKLSIERDMDGK